MLDEIKKFLQYPNGTMGRAFGHFAGELSASKCKAYCSCNSFNYAGIDESFCWCGNSEGEACSGDNDCFTVSIYIFVVTLHLVRTL